MEYASFGTQIQNYDVNIVRDRRICITISNRALNNKMGSRTITKCMLNCLHYSYKIKFKEKLRDDYRATCAV